MHICNKVIAFMIIIPKQFTFTLLARVSSLQKVSKFFSLKINNLFVERGIELKTGLDSQNIEIKGNAINSFLFIIFLLSSKYIENSLEMTSRSNYK